MTRQQKYSSFVNSRASMHNPVLLKTSLDDKESIKKFWETLKNEMVWNERDPQEKDPQDDHLKQMAKSDQWLSSPEMIEVMKAVQRLGKKQAVISFPDLYKELVKDIEGCKLLVSNGDQSLLSSESKSVEEKMLEETNKAIGPAYFYYQKVVERMHRQGMCLFFPNIKNQPVITDFSWLQTELNRMISIQEVSIPVPQNKQPGDGIDTLYTILEKFGIIIRQTKEFLLTFNLPEEPDFPMDSYWSNAPASNEVQLSKCFLPVPELPPGWFSLLLRNCTKIAPSLLIWKNGLLAQHGAISVLLEKIVIPKYEPVCDKSTDKDENKEPPPLIGVKINEENSGPSPPEAIEETPEKKSENDQEASVSIPPPPPPPPPPLPPRSYKASGSRPLPPPRPPKQIKRFPEGATVVYLAVRTTYVLERKSSQDSIMKCLWSVLMNYLHITGYTAQKYMICTQIFTPCPHWKVEDTCNRTKFYRHHMVATKDSLNQGEPTAKCADCKKEISLDHVLGPRNLTKNHGLAPVHTIEQIQFDVNPKVDYNKCFLCNHCAYEGMDCPFNGTDGETSRHCGCKNKALLCHHCGVCSRCTKFLNKVKRTMSPGLGPSKPFGAVQMYNSDRYSVVRGSHIDNGGKAPLSLSSKWASLDPIHFPYFEVMVVPEKNAVTTEIVRAHGKPFLQYNLKSGVIADYGDENNVIEHKDDKWIVSETSTIRFHMRFDTDGSCKALDKGKVRIDLYKNGEIIFTKKTQLQILCGMVTLRAIRSYIFLHAPGLQEIGLPPPRKPVTDMLVEIKSKTSETYILAEIAERNTDFYVFKSVMDQNPEKIFLEPFSTDIFPVYYSFYNNLPSDYFTIVELDECPHCKERNIQKLSECEYCATSLRQMELVVSKKKELKGNKLQRLLDRNRVPLWLFPQCQRANMEPYPTPLADQIFSRGCEMHIQAPAQMACQLAQRLPFMDDIIFAQKDVAFTGRVAVVLPSYDYNKLHSVELSHMRQEALTRASAKMRLHPLCYFRANAVEMLVGLSDRKLSREEYGKFWQMHLLDSPGEEVNQIEIWDCMAVLLCCHTILNSKELELVSFKKIFPDSELTESEVKKLLPGLLDLYAQALMMHVPRLDLQSFIHKSHLATAARHIVSIGQQNKMLQYMITQDGDELLLCQAHSNCLMDKNDKERKLTEFPMSNFCIEGVSHAPLIRSLSISNAGLEKLPEEFFSSFLSLVDLDVSKNLLVNLPRGIGSCRALCKLNLQKNQLETLPEDFADLKEYPLELDISGNSFPEFPEIVCHLENMIHLQANELLLVSLPVSFGKLKELQHLSMKNNCLHVLPPTFCQLKRLQSLSLSGMCWFKCQPKMFLSLAELVHSIKETRAEIWLKKHKDDEKTLYKFFDEDSNGLLDENEVAKMNASLFHIFPRFRGTEEQSGFPPEILDLESLEFLDLQYQGITHIPDGIGNLKKLDTLILSNNPYLETISPYTGRLPLKRLALEDCPSVRTPPKEIIAKGFQSTLVYLRRLLSGSVECKRTKLMLVGLGGVGKTSLVKAIMSGQGTTEKTTEVPQVTDGIDICTWTVTRDSDSISYSVWDFAGQTVYYNTHQFFLSDRAVYLLLWNIRQGHEHAGLDFWLNSIAVHAPKAPILVVGTHLDEVSKVEIPVEEMQEKYSQIKGFHFVSSHSGQGIPVLQDQLLDVTLAQSYMGEQIPKAWLNLEREILKLRSTQSVVKYDDIQTLSQTRTGIFDESELSQAVQFLHDLGSLQHFDSSFLKSHVVINPQWIVDVMSCVVSVMDSPIVDGNFDHKDIPIVWKSYPEDLHSWLLRLTEEYDLTFQLPDKPVNLVPCLLPERQPHFEWPEVDRESGHREAKMVYKFDYLPAGLFNRAQVRLYEFSDSSVIWKRGSMLRKNGHVALLTQLRDSELHVKVIGTSPENVLFLVHEVYEGLIMESFQGVVYDYLMPCPDCSKAHVRDPHMFAASSIRRATQLKAPFLQCSKYFHVIPLRDLHSMMPPESSSDYDLQLVQTVRGLTDLRKDLTADIFISYCVADLPEKNESRVSPKDICRDLEDSGYRCWFPEDPSSQSLEATAIALRDARIFLACISDNYIEDGECCTMFKYATTTLKKNIVLVVLGNSMDWQTSQIGLLVAGELYVNMQQKDRYNSKLEELARKLDSNTLLKKDESVDYPPVFISYSWANSARAVQLGTRQVEGATGYGDPREYKDFLESHGIKCWLDIEQTGANGLFEDIAVGLQNAKLVVACISDQYALSANCNMEFRFAKTALNLPIVIVAVGSGLNWRQSEVGMLSINYPVIAHDQMEKLLALVKENLPKDDDQKTLIKKDGNEKKKHKEQVNQQQKTSSFQELYELAQRKFLRQVAKFANSFNMTPYPRLIVIDHTDEEEETNGEEQVEEVQPVEDDQEKEKESDPQADPQQQYCFKILCEHEQGWHIAGSAVLANNVNDAFLHKLIPYLVRIMAIVRHSKDITLNCITGEKGEKYFKWLEEAPQAVVSEWQEVYRELLEEVMAADKNKSMAGLARCHLPNGKTAWLCEEHRSHGRITVLNSDGNAVVSSLDSGKENIMLKELKAPDNELTQKYKAKNEEMAAAIKDKIKIVERSMQSQTSKPETSPVSDSAVNPIVAAAAEAMSLSTIPKTSQSRNKGKARFKAAGIVAAAAGVKNKSSACHIL
ncbi:uncharacterized protein LOC106177527 isoform X2 [Lingula anatina]|uniref:non-specific serine/threonine protein kinase n=1 Tax=Lingula anatina TaxID=7574 RepID=A0A1S3JZG0_LINAN|nr:uncharacterized protein LOC106177527 isoform X2 [Lingula anatina]|eukprot:XP_013415785.1 uncharacterized protein LOC106177527 isoform X2 [Lingula anatina]